MKCKECKEEFDSRFGEGEFCDRLCAEVSQGKVRASFWRTIVDFTINRGVESSDELTIDVIAKEENGT